MFCPPPPNFDHWSFKIVSEHPEICKIYKIFRLRRADYKWPPRFELVPPPLNHSPSQNPNRNEQFADTKSHAGVIIFVFRGKDLSYFSTTHDVGKDATLRNNCFYRGHLISMRQICARTLIRHDKSSFLPITDQDCILPTSCGVIWNQRRKYVRSFPQNTKILKYEDFYFFHWRVILENFRTR